MSPGQSKSNDAARAQRLLRFHKILYRRFPVALFVSVICLGVVSDAVPAFAQEEIPQIAVGERKPTKKKDSGPRAIAVLQLNAKGKASLVPIAILINGKFWDATAYKADPIPMALEPGTVYEAERTGNSVGLFTVGSALHSNAANAPTPWLGTGAWLPGGADNVKAPLKAETVPVGIDTSDQPPRLSKNPAAAQPTPSAPSSTQPSSTPPQTQSPPSAPQSSDPDAPPRLSRPPSSTPTDSTQTPTSPSPTSSTPPAPNSTSPSPSPSAGSKPPDAKPSDSKPDSKPPDSKPADTKPADAKPDRPQAPASDSGASESSRPRLRRGKAVAEPPDEDVPGYSKFVASSPSATTAPKNAAAARVAAAADQGSIQSIPAISDASGPDPRPFTYEWLKDAEGERRQQVVALAKDQIRAYLAAQAKARIALADAPKPAAQTTRRTTPSKPSAKGPEPILENVQMITYDLWDSNQPVIIFSAEAHLPPPPAGAPHSETDSELRYSITLVAYPDIYNNLHKLYVGVTDKYHLDLTPRLDLIDAVDADGDGRGELLFKETTDAGTGWIIYRATADKLWKMFDSLNPQ